MPGPPSQLHHPALLFSWVAGLITDLRWHTIGCASTHACAHAHIHAELFLAFFLSIPLSRFPFTPFFLSHCHILSSYSAPQNFFLSLHILFSLLFSLSLCHILFSRTWHTAFLFLFLCHQFFYFFCSFFRYIAFSSLSLHSLSPCVLSSILQL